MNLELKQIRINNHLTQKECSDYLNIPINTLRNWEQGARKPSEWIQDLVLNKLLDYNRDKNSIYNEENGILSYTQIKNKVNEVSKKYDINKVYLFGSYAKGLSKELSDIDLFMESEITGLDYFGVVEDFRETLGKGIDLLSNKTVIANSKVDIEIKTTGVLIYER